MKKLLIGLATIVGLLVAAALAVPLFVPIDSYKAEIIALIKTATGRDLRIGGRVSFSLDEEHQVEGSLQWWAFEFSE